MDQPKRLPHSFCLNVVDLPRSAAFVGQTQAGFLSNAHSDDYVSDLCVFPQWRAHLRIAHVAAPYLHKHNHTKECWSQPPTARASVCSLIYPTQVLHLTPLNAAAEIWLLFNPIQQVLPAWDCVVIRYSNSSGVYIKPLPNRKFNLHLKYKHPLWHEQLNVAVCRTAAVWLFRWSSLQFYIWFESSKSASQPELLPVTKVYSLVWISLLTLQMFWTKQLHRHSHQAKQVSHSQRRLSWIT